MVLAITKGIGLCERPINMYDMRSRTRDTCANPRSKPDECFTKWKLLAGEWSESAESETKAWSLSTPSPDMRGCDSGAVLSTGLDLKYLMMTSGVQSIDSTSLSSP